MLLPEFKKLRKKPDRAVGLPDLLNYAAFVAPGIILMKDGALLAGFAYAGPDLNSSSPEELASLTQHVNSALARFGDGWMLNVDLIRHESASYPEDGEFPDPTTRLIDRERQIHYTAERRHFETSFALTTTFRPPPDLHRRAARLFFSDNAAATDWNRILDSFQRTVAEFQDALSASLRVVRMDDATLLTHLNACITGRLEYRRAPKFANYLDAVLGNHRFVSGFKPAVGGRHIRVVAPAGFPLESHAEVTAFLNELAIPYRWSTRAIFLDPQTAVRELSVWRRNWFQKRLGFAGILKETFGSGTTAAFQNQHALQMAADADSAVAEAQDALVRYCFYTTAVVVTEDDPADRRCECPGGPQAISASRLRRPHRTHQRQRSIPRLAPRSRSLQCPQAVAALAKSRRPSAAHQRMARRGAQPVPILSASKPVTLLRGDDRCDTVSPEPPRRRRWPHVGFRAHRFRQEHTARASDGAVLSLSECASVRFRQGLLRVRAHKRRRRKSLRSRPRRHFVLSLLADRPRRRASVGARLAGTPIAAPERRIASGVSKSALARARAAREQSIVGANHHGFDQHRSGARSSRRAGSLLGNGAARKIPRRRPGRTR